MNALNALGPDAGHVVDSPFITRLLTRLRVEVAPIALSQGGLSTALRLAPEDGRWWIETPSTGQSPAAGEVVSMSFRVDGVVARCQVIFEDTDHVGGERAWRLRYPQRLDYRQKRSSYRAVTLLEGRIAIHLGANAGECHGVLLDMSSTGFGAQLPVTAVLGRAPCMLRIDLDEPLQVSVEILHRMAMVGDTMQCRVGGRFLALSPAQQLRVDRAAAALQGRWLRARIK